jgi:hypothetical protein
MRSIVFAAACLATLAVPARAEITSAYTDFDTDTGCTTFSAPAEDEAGDWADLVCDGWRGYPVFLYYADARESLFYGFPPAGDLAPAWESFAAFNSSGPKIEWRLDDSSGSSVPFATIHRRFVSDPEDDAKKTEVLVVSKVGQPGLREGCVIGYVAATGNPEANEQAREIAEGAGSFACGSDAPVVKQGKVPVPPFHRNE